jgi:hypothetical protein
VRPIQEVAPSGLSFQSRSPILLDDRLMAILKHDIGIFNIRSKAAKCISVNLLELFSCGNNSFRSKSTLWMIADTLLAIAPSFGYT